MQKTPEAPTGHQRKQLFFADHKAEAAFGSHFTRWCGSGGCIACPLHKNRKNLVLYRGHLPCDVLFIGEGPGRSEDMLGYPFVGDAGRELDGLIARALMAPYTDCPPECRWCGHSVTSNQCFNCGANHALRTIGVTNIVACLPLEPDAEGLSSGELRPPKKEEAVACRERLREIAMLAAPRLLVTLGDIAKRFLQLEKWTTRSVRVLNLVHPSAILRTESPSQQVILEKRFVIQLADALRSL